MHRTTVIRRGVLLATVTVLSCGLALVGTAAASADPADAAPVATTAGAPAFAPWTVDVVGEDTGDGPSRSTASSGAYFRAVPAGQSEESNVSYQWFRAADAVSDGEPIPGAVGSGYVVQDDDVDAFVHVVATQDDGFASDSVSSRRIQVGVAPAFGAGPGQLSATVGEPFSYTATATGTGPVTYSVAADSVLPDGLTMSPDGVLSGTPTEAGSSFVELLASSPFGEDQEFLEIRVAGGPAVASGVIVVEKGVEIVGHSYFLSDGEHGDPVAWKQGHTYFLYPVTVDADGNQTGGFDPEDLTVTSSVASDRIVRDGDPVAWPTITFDHASPHVITVQYAGFTTSFTAQVQPTVVAPTPPTTGGTTGGGTAVGGSGAPAGADPVVTRAPTTATGVSVVSHPTRAGALASTGSDDSSMLGWALGLVAAGLAVTGARLRRRSRV